MKQLYCHEFMIGKTFFFAPCFHWREWFILAVIDINSYDTGENFEISLKILCFSLNFIFCWVR